MMAHAEQTVLIGRPLESVFDFVLNGANNKLWKSSVSDVKPLTSAPYGAGSRFKQGLRGPSGRIPADYEITESNPHELIRFQVVAGPMRNEGAFRFRVVDGATEVKFVLDYSAKPMQVDTQMLQETMQLAAPEPSMLATLGPQEKRVMELAAQGKSNQQIARSLSLGEGTIRNTLFSIQCKLMEPVMQRALEQEAAMLDELKALLEKHA
jgi:uncharacterized membrane protein